MTAPAAEAIIVAAPAVDEPAPIVLDLALPAQAPPPSCFEQVFAAAELDRVPSPATRAAIKAGGMLDLAIGLRADVAAAIAAGAAANVASLAQLVDRIGEQIAHIRSDLGGMAG